MILGLSGTLLDPAGGTPCATTWIMGLGAKISIFLPGSPNTHLLKMHPLAVFFILPELALLPALDF